MKRVFVLSLGGSLIFPTSGVNNSFLSDFKSAIKKLSSKNKFVIVCGGGSVARSYINSLRQEGISEHFQSLVGISSTRSNARFVSYFFGLNPKTGIPHDMKHVDSLLNKHDVVFCGALRYADKQTSDSTAVKLANYLNAEFVNLTNVSGLFSVDPNKNKDAKLITKISARDLHKMASSSRFVPGQHFVIDQFASKLILKNKIKTFIVGPDVNNFASLIKGKDFIGTTITF